MTYQTVRYSRYVSTLNIGDLSGYFISGLGNGVVGGAPMINMATVNHTAPAGRFLIGSYHYITK
jgi:hypothetical protein